MKTKESTSFSINKRILSFKYAFNGFIWLFKYEHNARIHLIALIFAGLAGFFFGISYDEWILILIVSGFVFSAEAFNSAIEFIADEVSLEKRDNIRKSKDLAATAVLIAAIVALIVGIKIFLPKILTLLNNL